LPKSRVKFARRQQRFDLSEVYEFLTPALRNLRRRPNRILPPSPRRHSSLATSSTKNTIIHHSETILQKPDAPDPYLCTEINQKIMFLTTPGAISTLKIQLDTRHHSISVNLQNGVMGAITCRLIDAKKREISSIRTEKSAFLWSFNFSAAGLRSGNYWIILKQEEYLAMQKLTIY